MRDIRRNCQIESAPDIPIEVSDFKTQAVSALARRGSTPTSGRIEAFEMGEKSEEVFEAFPIHPEAIQPVVKMVSGDLLIMSETVHRALKPLEHMVWNYDQVMAYLDVELDERLKNTSPDQIITPNPTVAVPAMQALRITGKEPDLRAMYANLLVTSMKKDTAQNAHPAFVQIISQMTGDEAKIFGVVAADQVVYLPEIQVGIPSHH